MKRNHIVRFLVAVGVLGAIFRVYAADVANDVKAANTAACMKMAGKFDKYAPADQSKWPIYCACVSETYWRSIPQTDYNGMSLEYQSGNYDGPHAKSLNDHVDERLQAAEKQCSGK